MTSQILMESSLQSQQPLSPVPTLGAPFSALSPPAEETPAPAAVPELRPLAQPAAGSVLCPDPPSLLSCVEDPGLSLSADAAASGATVGRICFTFSPNVVTQYVKCKLMFCLMVPFFSVALVYFSDQNRNSQNSLFNLHIISSIVHFMKVISHSFEKTANALAHSCKLLRTYNVFLKWLRLVEECS